MNSLFNIFFYVLLLSYITLTESCNTNLQENKKQLSISCGDSIFQKQHIITAAGDTLKFLFKYDSLLHTHIVFEDQWSNFHSLGMNTMKIIREKDDNDLVVKCKLTNSAVEEYYIHIGSPSSNYNNSNFVIIWWDGGKWNATLSNFMSAQIKDVDGDGISEIIDEYNKPQLSAYKSQKVYFFSHGNFIPYKLKDRWNKI